MNSYRVDLRERDIDVFGHVHYAEYLVFCAQARNRWLSAVGIQRPGDHVVARVEVDYLASAHLADERVDVLIAAREVGTSSLALEEEVRSPDGRVLVRLRSVIVRYEPSARGTVAWTEDERQALDAANI